MNVTEFEDWLDRLGEDVSHWPDPQRNDARALLAESAAARSLLDEAVTLRHALAAPVARAPAGLADRIFIQAARSGPEARSVPEATPVAKAAPKTRHRLRLPPIFRPSPAVLLPLCFVVGLLVGVLNHPEEADVDQVDLPSYVAHVVDVAHDAD